MCVFCSAAIVEVHCSTKNLRARGLWLKALPDCTMSQILIQKMRLMEDYIAN